MGAGLLLTSCGSLPPSSTVSYTAVGYQEIPGWSKKELRIALKSFSASCGLVSGRTFNNVQKLESFDQKEWDQLCHRSSKIDLRTDEDARDFFMKNFVPWKVSSTAHTGLFTGYYEIELKGSRIKTDKFKYPIYARPKDLIGVSLKHFDRRLPRRKIFGREKNGSLRPYLTREQIENHELLKSTEVLAWGDNLTDIFFLQIQGSGRVLLPHSQTMQIGYAANNGHPYTAIGQVLIKKGLIEKENLSMQSIRSWLAANPSKVRKLLNHNARYIFFRELPGSGVVGALGVKLTPRSSIAIDPNFIPLGAPVWISTSVPETKKPLQRLMIAQDTGAAITGPIRADIFFGTGSPAADIAGRMKQTGDLFILLPKGNFNFQTGS